MTANEKKALYATLSAPFPEDAIERTDGRVTGRGYSTTGIKYQCVVNRLNEVLGIGSYRAHRTVSVKEMQTAKGRPAFEAICDLTLELGEWINGEFVCFAGSLSDGAHQSMSEGDARKLNGAAPPLELITQTFRDAWSAATAGRVTEEAGLTVSRKIHILRHTFCSRLAMHGAQAIQIMSLAGHSDLKTTQRYMHLSPAMKDSAIRLLEQPIPEGAMT